MDDLRSGCEFSLLLGSLVTLDVTDRHGLMTVNGILVSTLDRYKEEEDENPTKTILTIGSERVVLDWTDTRTEAKMSKLER